MFLVSKEIYGQTMFARARFSCIEWVSDPNQASVCYRRSTAIRIAEGIEGNVVDVTNSAMYVR